MKNTALYIFSFILLIGLCSNSCDSQKDKMGELINKEAIYKDLEKGHEGISKDDICVDEIQQFETLFIGGYFAHDRGCGDNKYYYMGNSVELDNKTIQLILVNNGFNDQPEKVAANYNEYILNHNKSVITTAPEVFEKGGHDFSAPKSWIENNQVISQMWIKRPSGMIPEHRFFLSEVIFDMNGILISTTQKLKFTVPIK